jgi:Tfp pilus assembly protein PilF
MRAAAEKAIELDPLLADAHEALGLVYSRYGQWEQAEKSFRYAIQLDPNRSITYTEFAQYLLRVLGRNNEAIQLLRIAERLTRSHRKSKALWGFYLSPLVDSMKRPSIATRCQQRTR